MRSILAFATLLLFAACAQPGAVAESDEEAPNASQQRPAFEGQTRAPRVSSNIEIEVQTLAEGLWHPWAIAFLPSGDALVTERNGHLRLMSAAGVMNAAEIEGVPYMPVTNQGGLLDVAVSPNFATDRSIFLSYAETRANDENATSVARARLSADHRRLESFQVIFRQQPAWESEYHFGSRLVFDREGRLYVTLGERARAPEHAQDLSDTLGKVLRINTDGSTIRLSAAPAPRRRSGLTGTATCKAPTSIRKPVSSGPSSMARKAATNSTRRARAAIMVGRSSAMARIMAARRSGAASLNRKAWSSRSIIGIR
jgi:glucose/arabinose dehydrogenase